MSKIAQKKRVKKPRNTEEFRCANGYWELVRGNMFFISSTGYAKRLHAWLAKYIAWAEQEKERCK